MEWIDVNVRMPDEEKKYGLNVLCHYVSYSTDKRTYRTTNILVYSNGKFYYNYVGNAPKEVTHWMPIPSPPKIKKQ